MCLEMFVYDILVLCLVVELSVYYFGLVNCWECVVSVSLIFVEFFLVRSSLWIGFKVLVVVLIIIYKGKLIRLYVYYLNI